MKSSVEAHSSVKVGDGTTSVVIIAAELLKAADDLVKNKLHPTTVINGYRLACKEAVKYLQVCFLVIRVSLYSKYLKRNLWIFDVFF